MFCVQITDAELVRIGASDARSLEAFVDDLVNRRKARVWTVRNGPEQWVRVTAPLGDVLTIVDWLRPDTAVPA